MNISNYDITDYAKNEETLYAALNRLNDLL